MPISVEMHKLTSAAGVWMQMFASFLYCTKTKGVRYWSGSYMLETVWTLRSSSVACCLGMSCSLALLDRTTSNFKRPMQYSTLFWGILELQVRRTDEYLFGISTNAGKRAATRRWLHQQSPTILEWTSIMNDISLMEKITFCLCCQKDTCIKRWSEWVRKVDALSAEEL